MSMSASSHTAALFLIKLLKNNAFKRNKSHSGELCPKVPQIITLLQIPAPCVVRRPGQDFLLRDLSRRQW